jgi:transcriptional regulator with XRE-family HTH domain
MPVNHEKIKSLRKNRELTLEQAAAKAGMRHKQHWSNIESGRQRSKSISVELLERVADALGVKPVELLK